MRVLNAVRISTSVIQVPSMERILSIREFVGIKLRKALGPLTAVLTKSRVSPNYVTAAGGVLNLAAAVLIGLDLMLCAGIVFLLAGCLDMLDGSVARASGQESSFGAFLDSTLDRLSEGVVLAAVAYWFAFQGRSVDVALVVVALLGSFLVSYTRARAESLGVDCKVGLMSRPERVVLLAIGIFFPKVMPYVVYVLVALTLLTTGQRMLHTYRQLRAK